MFIIGLTGPSGAGKGVVGKTFSKAGFPHIDGDMAQREVTVRGSLALKELEENFSNGIINADGNLNREKLGEIVFNDAEKLKLLNKVIHKHIAENMKIKIERYKEEGCLAVVIDGAALYESGIDKICDVVVAVISPEDMRREFIIKRDNIDIAKANLRINAQKEDDFYTQKADYVIKNDGTYEELIDKANDVAIKITEDFKLEKNK